MIDRLVTDPRHAVARAMLEQQLHLDSLARPCVDDTPFAHKGGSVGGVRHDGGVLLPGTDDALRRALLHRRTRAGRVAGRPRRAWRWVGRWRGPSRSSGWGTSSSPVTLRSRKAAAFVRFWQVVEQKRRFAFFDVST